MLLWRMVENLHVVGIHENCWGWAGKERVQKSTVSCGINILKRRFARIYVENEKKVLAEIRARDLQKAQLYLDGPTTPTKNGRTP